MGFIATKIYAENYAHISSQTEIQWFRNRYNSGKNVNE